MRRVRERLLTMIDANGFNVGCIWVTDEAIFSWMVSGKNKTSENKHICVARPIHSAKGTVWATVSSKGIIGLFSLKVIITMIRYVELLK